MCLCQLTYFFGFMIILQSSILLLVLACTNLTGLCCILLEDSQSSTSSPCEKTYVFYFILKIFIIISVFSLTLLLLNKQKRGIWVEEAFFLSGFCQSLGIFSLLSVFDQQPGFLQVSFHSAASLLFPSYIDYTFI